VLYHLASAVQMEGSHVLSNGRKSRVVQWKEVTCCSMEGNHVLSNGRKSRVAQWKEVTCCLNIGI